MGEIKAVEFVVIDEQGVHHGTEPRFFKFPAGELQMEPLELDFYIESAYAVLRTTDLEDIVKVGLWGNYFAAPNTFNSYVPAKLYVPYLPAGRSDKGACAAVGVYTHLLGAGNYEKIYTLDAHSEESLMLGAYKVIDADTRTLVATLAANTTRVYDGVIAPDAGARHRATSAADFLGVPVFVAEKERNQETGEIIKYSISGLSSEGHYLVVDDICDGGATFNRLAKCTSATLDLLVTHGIFSKGTDELLRNYWSIFTTDSVATEKPGVRVFPALSHMRGL